MSGKVHETAKKGTIDVDKVETPNGARLGIRKYIDGKIYLHYKAAGTEDLLTPEQVVECIVGVQVERIVYKDESDIL